ncbi:MAG: ABC transporter permease [Pyrinomonadaceae bacterium]
MTVTRAHEDETGLSGKPLVIIEARTNWLASNRSDLWVYRELLQALVLRDIKVRYKQTVLGLAWAVIQPLFLMLVFASVFGRMSGMPSDGLPYPLFAFAGLVPWTFLANTINTSGNSLVGNSSLITKVYFPRMIIPLSSVISGLIDFAISFALLVLLTLYYGPILSASLLMLPVLILLTALLAASIGLVASAVNVKYRDVRYALPFLIQVGIFLTPVIYPLSLVPDKWQWLLRLNPATGIIEGFRSAMFGLPLDWQGIGVSATITVALLFCSFVIFHRMERTFADVV